MAGTEIGDPVYAEMERKDLLLDGHVMTWGCVPNLRNLFMMTFTFVWCSQV